MGLLTPRLVGVSITIRPADADDAHGVAAIGAEAWGYPAQEPPEDPNGRGRSTWVAVDGDTDRTIAAAATLREYESWFWGARLPTAGVASVMVATEYRGRKLLRPLMTAALEAAHTGGAVIATMFPTAPGIYRSLGFEVFTELATRTVLPTASLSAVRAGSATLRRAGPADLPAVRGVHAQWAAAHNGPLTREGVSFETADEDVIGAFTGITLAEEDGRTTGYAAWNRGNGYHADGTLNVTDLICLTDDASRSLLHALGTHATVAPTTVLRTSLPDPALLPLPARSWRVEQSDAYGLAILDVAGAFGAAQVPEIITADLNFDVAGLPVPGQDGQYRLRVGAGRVDVERLEGADNPGIDSSSLHFEARGLALRFAGATSNTDLRRAGLISGPTTDDRVWDALFGGRTAHIRDYF